MTIFNQKAANAYRNVSIDSRGSVQDPYDLVRMTFETLLECLATARGAIEQGDVMLKVKKINHAVRIVQEGLLTNLDLRNGGDLAQNLYNLYDYWTLRLTQANLGNDVAAIEEVTQLVRSVADAWAHMRDPAAGSEANSSADTAVDRPNTGQEPPRAQRRMTQMYRDAIPVGGAVLAGA